MRCPSLVAVSIFKTVWLGLSRFEIDVYISVRLNSFFVNTINRNLNTFQLCNCATTLTNLPEEVYAI